MTSRGPRAALAAGAFVAAAAAAHAYNDDPIADRLFPSWNLPDLTRPDARGIPLTAIVYQVYVVGPHEAEIHFRNKSDETWHFDFWFPGRQRAGDNSRVHHAPWFTDKVELHVRAKLSHGRPGLSATKMRIYDLRRGADAGPALSPFADVAGPPPPDETWMPARPLVDDGVVRRSNLMARVVRDGAGASVEFKNPAALDVHFRFEIPALGIAVAATPRVTAPAGGEFRVALPPSTASSLPPSLARVVVCDMRVGDDVGPFFGEDRRADIGWLPLATADGSTALPQGKLLALLSPDGARGARVRFRSRMRTPVRLRFAVEDYQDAARRADVVTVEPGAETETVVALDRPADARLAVAHVRVFEVSHRDFE